MKKGFTLAELLGVILLLALLASISYPILIEQFEKKENEISQVKLDLIYSAAKNYAKLNLDGSTVCVFVDDLIDENLIAIDVSELEVIEETPIVKLDLKDNNNYNASLVSSCTDSSSNVYTELDCTDSELETNYTIYNYQNYYFKNQVLIKERNTLIFKNLGDTNDASYLNAINNYILLSNILKARDGINSLYTKGESDSEVNILVDYSNSLYNTTITTEEQTIINNASLYTLRPTNTTYDTINNTCN